MRLRIRWIAAITPLIAACGTGTATPEQVAGMEAILRERGGTVITHGRSEEQTRASIVSPLTMIASDGFIENGRGHPRTSGTYAKVLGKYVGADADITIFDPATVIDRGQVTSARPGRAIRAPVR